jgi:UDP-N-acetylglucosamine 2-epimerase
MRALSIIGTRPQYIKIKPIFDFCKKNNIDHHIADTCQHYSYNVSGALIKDLELEINYSLSLSKINELGFIAECIKALGDIFEQLRPDIVLVYGDTNSTFCAALAAYKLRIPIAHVEAGERCFDNSVPEEVNRKFVDDISNFNFCSSLKAAKNIHNGIYCGDLEYELLNNLDPNISFQDFGVMTIHRQANATREGLNKILSFCKTIPCEIKFFVHHRTKPLLPSYVPNNIALYDSCSYTEMVKQLSSCKFIITDSGGIQKTSAFFGKRTLVMREKN